MPLKVMERFSYVFILSITPNESYPHVLMADVVTHCSLLTNMDAKILRHKTLDGYHGMIKDGTLFRTGPSVVPQLFPPYCDKEWLDKSIKRIDRFVDGLCDFDLVDVVIKEKGH